jgi:NADPH2:quinone reductase
MKSIIVKQFGGPDVMKLEEVKTPEPAVGQVLVMMHAVGVNPVDVYRNTGNYGNIPLPFTPGADGAGIVEKTGPDVKAVVPGDRVYFWQPASGTYAEYALANQNDVFTLPEHLSFSQGAAVNIPYGTAYHALIQKACAKPGETLLVHGASGGVGIAAVQIGVALGMKVIGTAGSQKGLDLVLKQGAQYVLNHTSTDHFKEIMELTEGKGVDVILEMLANVNLSIDMKALALKGRITVIGSRGDITVTPRDLMAKEGAIYGIMKNLATETETKEYRHGVQAGLENNTLNPVVGKEIPLGDAKLAHEEIMKPGAYGKIVLIP